MDDAKNILARWSQMAGDRMLWDTQWQRVADYALPRKGRITTQEIGPGTNSANRLKDTTAIECVATLAAGHSSAITPAGTQWFAWEAPEIVKSDEADAWYNRCSEIARKVLGAGNFHTALNEMFEDRSGFGIACLGIMPHSERGVSFRAHPVGSFCVDEDSEGNVDTVFLRVEMSIRQIVQEFGEAAVAGNTKLASSWEKFKLRGIAGQHWLIHAVFPRIERDASKMDNFNMPIASVWVAEDGKSVLRRSGFPEFPYPVSRYLKRSGSKQQYGYSPFEQVEAAIVDANLTKSILTVARQKQAVPPMLIPDNLVGNVDTRPGGRTVFRSNGGDLPREWLTGANPNGLLEELQDSRQIIRNAYHYDLFRMFAEKEKVMTAREVAELAAEKLMPFSPSFTRFTADFQPAMERIFAVLFRAGYFGAMQDIPEAVRVQRGKLQEVPPPKVVYQSRVALAIRQAETAAADRLMERAMGVSQVDPAAMDNIDLDAYLRSSARNDGVSDDILRPAEAMQELRARKAQAMQQQAELDQATQAAAAAGAVGMKMPPGANPSA